MLSSLNVFFIFHNQEHQASIKASDSNNLPPPILHSFLIHQNKYEILSEVSDRVFHSFIDYFSHQKLPDISLNKLGEYERLNQELCVPSIQNLIESIKNYMNEGLLNVRTLCSHSILDKSEIEHKISKDLDIYVKNCGNLLLEAPIQSLYNILFYEGRNLTKHDYLSELILSHYRRTNDSEILILLSLIDGSLLTQQNLIDSIEKQKLELNFQPQIEILINKLHDLEQLNEKYKERWENANGIVQTDDINSIRNFFSNDDI